MGATGRTERQRRRKYTSPLSEQWVSARKSAEAANAAVRRSLYPVEGFELYARNGFILYTEHKNVTRTWFSEDQEHERRVNT